MFTNQQFIIFFRTLGKMIVTQGSTVSVNIKSNSNTFLLSVTESFLDKMQFMDYKVKLARLF